MLKVAQTVSGDVRAELTRLIRFGMVGLANTAVGFAVVALLQGGFRLDPFLSNAGGILVGIGVGFVLNKSFVFGGDSFGTSVLCRYIIAFILAFSLEQLVLAALLWNPLASIPTILAQVVALASYSTAYFLLCRFWIFARRRVCNE